MRITRWAGQDLQTPSQARTLPLRTTAAAVACARAPQACKYATVPDQLQKFRQMCPSASTCPGEAKHEDAEQQQEDEQAPAVVNAPYFGMLFVQRLLRNHDTLTLLGVSRSVWCTLASHHVWCSAGGVSAFVLSRRGWAAGSSEED